MIRVARPEPAPAALLVEGDARTAEDCAAYDRQERSFKFESSIYGHADVKSALVRLHSGKCCYCESKVRHVSPGTIDHYRPKTGSQQAAGEPLLRPGYYWLAYDWKNLLFTCEGCNMQHKRNLFPLANPGSRARSHHDDPSKEQPLLIDPSAEDPAQFIGFREEVAFAMGDNVRGRTTIEMLKLNERKDLVERRRERLEIFRVMSKVPALGPGSQEAADAEAWVRKAISNAGEYSAMLRAASP